jgi:anti-sigma-K factor RskA
MSTMNGKAPERRDIEDLLPWHAAGTLSRRDAERVEAAIAQDQELARRFELVREELAATIHLNESLGAPSARAMQTLFAAIEREGATSPRGRAAFGLADRVSEFFSALSPRTLAWSAGAAALVIVLQAAVLTDVALRSGATYGVAGAPGPAQQGAEVIVNFAPQASAAEITKFLQAHKATIVSGPAGGALYTLRLPSEGQSKEDLDRVVKAMQSERNVISFALPAPVNTPK